MNSIGKVKYVGRTFGVESLTNEKIYDVVDIDEPFIKVIDDSGEPYLYSLSRPSSMENPNEEYGEWILIETNDNKLKELLSTQK